MCYDYLVGQILIEENMYKKTIKNNSGRMSRWLFRCGMMVLAETFVSGRLIFECDRAIDHERLESRKFYAMFRVMDRWMEAKQNGKSIARGLLKCGYSTVAIYGMHYVGERLAEELKDSSVKVLYAIDKSVRSSNQNIPVFRTDEMLPQTDVIIVASTIYFYDMKQKVRGKVRCPVISIEEAVERMC